MVSQKTIFDLISLDKTLLLLKNGAMTEEYKAVKCIGCLKSQNPDSMQLEGNNNSFSSCAYCHSTSCMECTRKCDVCWRYFCKICVNVR